MDGWMLYEGKQGADLLRWRVAQIEHDRRTHGARTDDSFVGSAVLLVVATVLIGLVTGDWALLWGPALAFAILLGVVGCIMAIRPSLLMLSWCVVALSWSVSIALCAILAAPMSLYVGLACIVAGVAALAAAVLSRPRSLAEGMMTPANIISYIMLVQVGRTQFKKGAATWRTRFGKARSGNRDRKRNSESQ